MGDYIHRKINQAQPAVVIKWIEKKRNWGGGFKKKYFFYFCIVVSFYLRFKDS